MDMTPTVTEHGEAAAEGMVCVVEIITSSPYFATTTDLAVYPNKMPNATCTLTDYTHAANTHMIVIPLLGDMIFWSSSSNDGSFDTTFGTSYIAGAGGIFKAEGQPTGAAPDGRAITATSMATTGNQNWCLLRFEGVRMYDKS